MRTLASILTCAALALSCCGTAAAQTARVAVVAAENSTATWCANWAATTFEVTSILSNPDQDPHLVRSQPRRRRARCSTRRLVVYNGADYDPWMDKAARGIEERKAHDDRRGATGRQEIRRQSASLVRPGHDARRWRGR